MPPGLRQHALARIDQDDGELAVEAPVAMLRVYCSWPGVSATMNVRLRGGEEAVGDVDGDALLALGLEPVDQEGEVDVLAGRAVLRGILCQRGSWSSNMSFGIVEQPADQRRLAVIDRAAGEKAQRGPCRVRRAAISARLAARRSIRNSPPAFSSPSMPFRRYRSAGPGAPRRARGDHFGDDVVERCRVGFDRAGQADSSRACGTAPAASPAARPARAAAARHRP